MKEQQRHFVIAIPKGRIMPKASDLLAAAGIEIHATQLASRKLIIDTNWADVKVSIIRNSDILLAVRSGAADVGIVGSDQLLEEGSMDLYDLFDLGIAKCWLKVAAPENYTRNTKLVRVATKFPRLATSYYATRGIQAQIVKLSGAAELAVKLGLADEVVDLVETGNTLKENGLTAMDSILTVTSHLIANRDQLITKHTTANELLSKIAAVVNV